MIAVNADLNGLAGYIGAVDGILDAVESPGYQGDFMNDMISKLRRKFTADTIAANLSGVSNLSHVFEWPQQNADGTSTRAPSSVPLFRLVSRGKADKRVLTFDFLMSTMPVPLPDPERYGFKPEKLGFMRRHVFRMKALVMETQSNVSISPKFTKKLFIPSTRSKYGYFMSSGPVRVNPGGNQATGSFSVWWTAWFSQRAPEIIEKETQATEQWLKATGQKVIRYAAGTKVNGVSVGGQFAAGTSRQLGYVDAARRTAELQTLAAAKRFYEEDEEDYDI